jgi:uncharacterized damage-inducible protein DinB
MTGQTDDHDAALAQYADGSAQLEAALTGLTELDLNLALSSDAWTIRQIVHHIADGDDLWKTCIKAALGNSEGLFSLQWYWDRPQTEWAESWAYAKRSTEPSLLLFRANRQHIVDLIRQIPDAWEKSIRVKWPHREEGRITVGKVVEDQTSHVAGHIDDIRMIRRTHRV